ncbi:NAD(P)-dependent dehydrogenase, short-chain alcohol dehydrogenase family [Shimia gijangensis]|uniref:NAD(P)-dependent dehydrogenase, short-chain alcohol dehydrogenase family n=1 Tax=Shimia gijangensis TaxID=1470563 RepID=A0A1M6CLY6_9RHOB|nr:short chain dehydrogenase [Shimia gijangensis]SHI62027.1 NAD(P)-dependent dehydrogenase, short-chain alcohol dehydrogenase family [Shimia gijangensis]
MRILVIGASGTIGSAVTDLLSQDHEVVAASRKGEVSVDLSNAASILSMYDKVGKVDSVISTAGSGAFGPLDALSDEDFTFGLGNKLMGQINLVRFGRDYVRDNGSIVLTSGILADHPNTNSVLLTTLNSAVEGFARAAALGLPRGLRVNAVSPPLVRETAIKMGWGNGGVPASEVAKLYQMAALEPVSGQVAKFG